MYRSKTASRRVPKLRFGGSAVDVGGGIEHSAALSAGLSAAVQAFGHGAGTIRCCLTRAGERRNCVSDGERLHERQFRDLWLGQAQPDKLMVQMRGKGREMRVWVALEVETKLMSTFPTGGPPDNNPKEGKMG